MFRLCRIPCHCTITLQPSAQCELTRQLLYRVQLASVLPGQRISRDMFIQGLVAGTVEENLKET